jgi:hypothetical protein
MRSNAAKPRPSQATASPSMRQDRALSPDAASRIDGKRPVQSLRRMMANVGAERLLKTPAEPSPELRIPGAAAQTRVVSMAGIRLDSRKSVRAFKGIVCDDVSEIAVGTLITERPPHRSVRAQFGHTAPTLGV